MQGNITRAFVTAIGFVLMGYIVAISIPNMDGGFIVDALKPAFALAQEVEHDEAQEIEDAVEPDYNLPIMPDSTPDVDEPPMALATKLSPAGSEAVEAQRVQNLLNEGKFVPAIALIVTLLLRMPGVRTWFKKLPQRARIIVPIALAGTAGTVVAWYDGMTFSAALFTGFFGGSTASVFWHQLFFKSVAPGRKPMANNQWSAKKSAEKKAVISSKRPDNR